VAHSPGVTFENPTPVATSFPQVILTAASFDVDLIARVATAISTEGRAMHNAQRAGLTFWTPNINVFVEPRWGRGQETPGEDPFWNGLYGSTFVANFQNNSQEDQAYWKASACVKHFDAYHLETDRLSFDGNVSAFDLNKTYLVPFKAAIPHASCVMCAYVALNGVPSCANAELMEHYVREVFHMEG
jgi:beta-glucosidase-like glycosyl hydrolase